MIDEEVEAVDAARDARAEDGFGFGGVGSAPDGGVELADVLVERADAVRVGADTLRHPPRAIRRPRPRARERRRGRTTRARPSPGRSGRAGKTRSDTARGARIVPCWIMASAATSVARGTARPGAIFKRYLRHKQKKLRKYSLYTLGRPDK